VNPIIKRKQKNPNQRKKICTKEENEKMLEKRRVAYQQKKINKPEQGTKRCAQDREQRKKRCVHDRQRCTNMQSENTKAKIEQVIANHELKSITTCKESFAMINPTYIATELEVCTSTLNVRRGETQTLPHNRNREFLANQRFFLSKLLVFDINWKT
jgi:predicted glycoside hydrolase/deacetylase ChbG (UPF0249 family)